MPLDMKRPYATLVGGAQQGHIQDNINYTLGGDEADENFKPLPKRAPAAAKVPVTPTQATMAAEQAAKQAAKA